MKENLCIFEVLVLRDFLSAVKSTCVRADNLTYVSALFWKFLKSIVLFIISFSILHFTALLCAK